MFVEGAVYNRRKDIHEQYGGQQQGGISTPAEHPYVFLFTAERGQDYGYKDGWTPEGKFLYTGEGQIGDQEFKRGNKAIRDHQKNGKRLLLFSNVTKGYCRLEGEMTCENFEFRDAPDKDGNLRKVIVFELRRTNEAT
jgi:5-methylcytosine-specific restriction protein A